MPAYPGGGGGVGTTDYMYITIFYLLASTVSCMPHAINSQAHGLVVVVEGVAHAYEDDEKQ